MLYSTLTAKFIFWEKAWKKLKPRFLWIGKIYSPIWKQSKTTLITDECFKLPHFDFNNPDQLLALIRSFLELEEELKRIYFYVSDPFTEAEPRIKSDKKEELERYKENNPKDYEERVRTSGIIQSFNHAIAQQNQVKLRVGRVKFKFVYEFEDKESMVA